MITKKESAKYDSAVAETDPPDPLVTVFDYHERTKHHFHRFANALDALDWASQPCPFRCYQGAPEILLPLPGQDTTPNYEPFFAGQPAALQPLNRSTISAFFYYSLALSAWKSCFGNRWSLRVNPSSGNLHPTECYLIADTIPELSEQPGIYHYFPLRHQLECRASLEQSNWRAITSGLCYDGQLPKGSFLVALTSIHWRESWKYGERAFRYCQHDCGHALAAVRIAAGLMGWQLTLIEGISDSDLARLVGIDRNDDFPSRQEREAPDLLAVVTPGNSELRVRWAPNQIALSDVANGRWQGKANLLSKSHHSWPWIDKVALACYKPETIDLLEGCSQLSDLSYAKIPLEKSNPRVNINAGKIIRQRRSALDMDGETRISKATFYQILSRTLPEQNPRLFAATTWPACVHLGLFVHRVDGVSPGLYLLLRDLAKVEQLQSLMSMDFIWQKPLDCPENLPLYCLHSADTQEVAKILSCHQSIASGGVFSCAMLAEFEQPLRQLGPWCYRRLFWEAGMIGQMLYLEAEAKGIRATGIGCFFDDPVHQLFGLKDRTYQSLYHFTMGGPVEDMRLETLAAYSAAR
ncbi:SagB/ThcOx family dehydrogenase [Photobacterium sp. SDRW27]|uniref:SagB/ThcOx family dehydrogenase n=1 Tax=Photobacterium obscurum TaxID=2829490 RepID=UPI002244D015|nr:SagB/ThcOx family dehydrogenase [Photobacterium obscurum]MCW8328930.1 SagB/ThcOx family dehydrogenase [Photobacterium obscurum]